MHPMLCIQQLIISIQQILGQPSFVYQVLWASPITERGLALVRSISLLLLGPPRHCKNAYHCFWSTGTWCPDEHASVEVRQIPKITRKKSEKPTDNFECRTVCVRGCRLVGSLQDKPLHLYHPDNRRKITCIAGVTVLRDMVYGNVTPH
ncbi:hypothetical protein BZA77DRAFT_290257 [Pyronema omphalodes]|nr:hypothetical protein BZA77DRAFT_290257 [Pyronema omphalodes]